MNKYDLLQAMSGIHDKYIEEAADLRGGETPPQEKKKKKRKILGFRRWSTAVAALLCLSILVPNLSPDAASAFQGIPLFGNYFRAVTFRSWQYETANADAYVEESEIVTLPSGGLAVQDYGVKESSDSGLAAGAEEVFSEEEADVQGSVAGDAETAVRAAASTARINEEMRRMAAEEIAKFEESVETEVGYRSLRFLHDVVTDTDTWFCLEVLAYTSMADGYEQVTHFNIDKETGEWVFPKDLFPQGADYTGPISGNIRSQMRDQMDADPDIEYWLDLEEEPESNFDQISPDQDFYINESGQLVICFNEMEAAPLYMGTLEFVIPQEIVDAIGN